MPTLANYQLAVWFLQNATFVAHFFCCLFLSPMTITFKALGTAFKPKMETPTVFTHSVSTYLQKAIMLLL